MPKRISEDQARSLFLANDLEPIAPYVNTMMAWESRCLRCGRVVRPNYNKVRLRGHQCAYCAGHKVESDEAVALMQRAGFEPLTSYPGGNVAWPCRCLRCERPSSPTYSAVRGMGTGCKFCAKRAVTPEDAVASMQSRGYEPLEAFPGAAIPWSVQCTGCGRNMKVRMHSVTNTKRCKFCAGAAIDPATAETRMRALCLEPLEPYRDAKTPWRCKCLKCGYVVQPTWSRISQGRGHCAYCARRRVDQDKAYAVMLEGGARPTTAFPGSNKPWEAVCLTCGSEVRPRFADVRQGQGACGYCAKVRVKPEEAIQKMLAVDLEPLVPYPGASKPWRCRCVKCGREVRPHYTTIQQGGGGCRFCAEIGINYTAPGYIYLMANDQLTALKIGIGNTVAEVNDRIQKHIRHGWTLLQRLGLSTAQECFEVEQATLKWLRTTLGLPPFLNRAQMPQGGWTETVDAAAVTPEDLWARLLVQAAHVSSSAVQLTRTSIYDGPDKG